MEHSIFPNTNTHNHTHTQTHEIDQHHSCPNCAQTIYINTARPRKQHHGPIGLCIKGVKYGYKSYKKHQSEKQALQDNAIDSRPEIMDPSHELGVVDAMPHATGATRDVRHLEGNTSTSRAAELPTSSASHASSSSSVDSATEAALANDVEFQQYMQRQKQAYLDQHHQSQNLNVVGGAAAPPPAYDAAMSHGVGQQRGVMPPAVVGNELPASMGGRGHGDVKRHGSASSEEEEPVSAVSELEGDARF